MNVLMRSLAASVIAIALTGCATSNPQDPLESYNRAMFNFNDKLDKTVLKPTAEVYHDATPGFVQAGIGNFFENLSDIWTSVNNLLQGKVEDGLNDAMRVAVNTTLGWGGLIDIGSAAGIPKHKQDFGTTLGVWGVPSGAYVVLPLLGPSTVRDTAALPADFAGDAWIYVTPASSRVAGSVVRVVDKRASALDAYSLIEEAALDRYEFIRDAYLQRRENKINEGRNEDDRRSKDDQSSNQPDPAQKDASASTEIIERRGEDDRRGKEDQSSIQADPIQKDASTSADAIDSGNIGILEPKTEKIVLLPNDSLASAKPKASAPEETGSF